MIKNLLKEFLILESEVLEVTKPVERDIPVSDSGSPFIIVRVEARGWTVMYLYSGVTIFFPAHLIAIMSEFGIHSGRQVEERVKNIGYDNLGPLEKSIVALLRLSQMFDNRHTIFGPRLDSLVKDLTVSRTTDLREWLTSEIPDLVEIPEIEMMGPYIELSI